MQVYRQEEEVSMYRVMARPWDYYGRTIWMECVKDTGGTLYPNNELKTDSERDIGIVGANMDIVDGKIYLDTSYNSGVRVVVEWPMN